MFHSFGIKDVLLKRLRKISIEKPTAIQEKVSFSYVVCAQGIFGQAVFSLSRFSDSYESIEKAKKITEIFS